jgi:hypothetical protein
MAFCFFIIDWGARKWKGFGWVNLLTKGHQRAWRPRKIHVYQDFFQSMNLMRSFSFSLCQTHLSAAMGLKENKESKIKQVPLSNKEANSQNLWPDLPQQLLHLINSTWVDFIPQHLLQGCDEVMESRILQVQFKKSYSTMASSFFSWQQRCCKATSHLQHCI